MNWLFLMLAVAATVPGWTWAYRQFRILSAMRFVCAWRIQACFLTAGWLLIWAAGFGSSAIPAGGALSWVVASLFHDHDGRKRRALRALGGKSLRALRVMVDTMRGIGHPVPDPA